MGVRLFASILGTLRRSGKSVGFEVWVIQIFLPFSNGEIEVAEIESEKEGGTYP